jgi:hypothetical protein
MGFLSARSLKLGEFSFSRSVGRRQTINVLSGAVIQGGGEEMRGRHFQVLELARHMCGWRAGAVGREASKHEQHTLDPAWLVAKGWPTRGWGWT